MAAPSEPDDRVATDARSARRLARGVSATWWYTASAIVMFELFVLFIWAGAFVLGRMDTGSVALVVIGGLIWTASTVVLLAEYRHRVGTERLAAWRRMLAPLLVAIICGALAGWVTGLWLIALLPLGQAVALLNWAPGVRLRVVLAVTVLLGALWVIDTGVIVSGRAESWPEAAVIGYGSILLPVTSVISLWWWDVLIALDRARASEARLAATRERLRVATDVHDLQGHHLQVIALQLELAERLLAKDPTAALEQLRASRKSVDAARQGTRDLALQFRSVPLGDEIANAVDLLRSAGTRAEANLASDVDLAPAAVLGPVIRETTTNVLRHGGREWATLSLTRVAAGWRYEISNDSGPSHEAISEGSGLVGLARRAKDAGGAIEVHHEEGVFAVTMTVPEAGATA